METGDIYHGTFVNGIKEGEGEINFKNGNHFKGKFKNDLINGSG